MTGAGAAATTGVICYLPGFHFDPAHRRLSGEDVEVRLRPKTATVLAALISRAGEVVTKQELLHTVWPEGFIGDAALSVCINELRHVLGDDARAPTYIATEHGQGYRLVADVSTRPREPAGPIRPFVGRTAALSTLDAWWSQATAGVRSVGFVAAQAGVGKTALLDAFAEHVGAGAGLLIGRGQCVQLYGPGEPYLPVLEALAGLCRGPGGSAVVQVLRRTAPTWLAELPGVLDEPAAPAVELRSPERMLREFAVAVETLSAHRPLLLIVEDLHDADRATVELISYLARRRDPARLLLVGSYRPAEVIAREHPLHAVTRDLGARGLGPHLILELLSRAEVEANLSVRLAPARPSVGLVSAVLERTEGNALFVAAVCDHLRIHDLLVSDGGFVRAVGGLAALGVPDEVRLMLERQVAALPGIDQRLLSVAAVAGVEFTTEAVRAALGDEVSADHVEERFDRLAHQGALLAGAGTVEWPDGTLTGRYRFVHAMYREVLYDRMGPNRRICLHRAVGARLKAGYAHRAAEFGAELALHFERGRDYPEAVARLGQAARTALGRSAYPEARREVRHGLDLLDRVADPDVRSRLELALLNIEVAGAAVTWGWHDAHARDSCHRLRTLAVEQADTQAHVAALLGLHNASMLDGDERGMLNCVRQVDELAARTAGTTAQLTAHLLHIRAESRACRWTQMWRHAQAMLDADRPSGDPMLAVLLGDELDVAAHLYGGLALWHLGYPDSARQHVEAALASARMQGIPAGLARALWFAAVVCLLRGDAARVHDLAGELEALCRDDGLILWRGGGRALDGWANARLGLVASGLARTREALTDWGAVTSVGSTFHHRLVAELCLDAGDIEGGLAATATGLATIPPGSGAQSEEELLRLRGELLIRADPGDVDEAERCLRRAVEVAREREGRSDELRAATSLARLLARRSRVHEARSVLAGLYATFTEGYDTADLTAARGVLDALTRPRSFAENS